MSETLADRADPLPLPGFPPDAVPFAIRTTLALLLGYLVSFAIQLDTASSTGVCVAIVAQPLPGMAMTKAFWRMAGTVLGGVVSLVFIAAFPQDRTMLLLSFTLWLGACTFVAALLRDFRSYGAVLCGYTVGIVALGSIDAPEGVLMAALNRVAAILIGIVSVAVVNLLLAPPAAFQTLVPRLQGHLAKARELALDVLEGRAELGERASIHVGASILSLRTQATYAKEELPDGAARRDGAVTAIAGLLGMLSATRALSREPDDPAFAPWLTWAAASLRADGALPPCPATPGTPAAAFMAERTEDLLTQYAMAAGGLRVLEQGGRVQKTVRMDLHYDQVGAGLSAFRTVFAAGAGSVFCVVSGWPGSTGLLIQQAAFTALLGMTPNPSAAGAAMGWALLPASVAAGIVGFLLLPVVSGFVPFALAVAPFVFALALAGRYPALQRFGAGFMLYFTLLLAPSNVQSFDLSTYLNNELVQVLAVAFMVLAFELVLPVSRRRRLFRIADAVISDLTRTMKRGRTLDAARTHWREYDRMEQAETWVGVATPARHAVMGRLAALIDLDLELRRAWSGLPGAGASRPLIQAALLSHDPAVMRQAASTLMAEGARGRQAVSGLHAAARLLDQQWRALHHYGVVSRF